MATSPSVTANSEQVLPAMQGLPTMSAKALGKRRMADVVDAPQNNAQEAAWLASLGCCGPPPSEPPLCNRPSADTSQDEALAAMYQAEYERDLAELGEARTRDANAAYNASEHICAVELFGEGERDIQMELAGLTVEQKKSYMDKYQRDTDELNEMLDKLDRSRNADINNQGYGLSDEEVDPHDIELDAVVGVPVVSSYFPSNMFEPLIPSPTKPPRKKRVIKIDPEDCNNCMTDDDNEQASGPSSCIEAID
jgi:hypothetical protein